MAASDARPIPRKNTAYRVTFPLLDADGDLVTGAGSLDSEVSKDGGTFADATSEATEIATSSGMYYLDLTADEMNADTVAVIVKSASAKTTPIVIYPEEAGDVRCDLTTQAKSDVNAEVVDALATDTYAELASVPAATSSLKDKLNWLFLLARNKRTQTSTTETVFADNGTSTVATSAKSDSSGTFTRSEYS